MEIYKAHRLIVRHCGNAHPHLCEYLKNTHGFKDLCRYERDSGSKSKVAHFKDLIGDLFYALKNIKSIRNAREIITTGPMAANIAFLNKVGLLPSCKKIYWFGFFVHNPRWLRILRSPLKILDSRKIQYVLFSNYEKTLYKESLFLNENRMYYIPYGDISSQMNSAEAKDVRALGFDEKEFFFSGGYSNRDYPALIEIFKTLPYNLVIICASLNTEINESDLPPNIKVMRDVPSNLFEAYVKAARACIIPIAHNTGAAGQSCLLRFMKNRKIIIASDTGIIREYITNGVSGILVKDNCDTMATAIRAVHENIEHYQKYANAAHERFIKVFSGEAIKRRLDELVDQIS